MKPTSEQTRNGEDLLNMKSFFHYDTGSSDAAAAEHPIAVDPLIVYGCVDWFIYPDPKTGHA